MKCNGSGVTTQEDARSSFISRGIAFNSAINSEQVTWSIIMTLDLIFMPSILRLGEFNVFIPFINSQIACIGYY